MRTELRASGSVNLAAIALIACAHLLVCNTSCALQGNVRVHDPCAIRVGNTTYAFSTGFATPITVRKTTDLTMYGGWTYIGRAPNNTMPAWIGPMFTAKGLATPDNLWAPDINYWNGKYYLYYSSSVWGTSYAVCGVATATNIEGPWTDQGLVTDVNYPIDTKITWSNNVPYISWGSWTGGGIYLRQIDLATGKLSTANTNLTKIASGVEGVSIVPSDGYFYMLASKGVCCSGTNSTYYTVLARATNLTGPYLDRNGIAMTDGGGTTVLTGFGTEIGAGGGDWFQVGPDRFFAYHFYDGTNNGTGTLNIRKIDFAGGWLTFGPVLGATYHKLQNRATGLFMDGMGLSALGAHCGQNSGVPSYNQQWYIESAGSYVKLRNHGTGLYLDGMGLTANGSYCGQYSSGGSHNQQWEQETVGGYIKFKNRATGLYLDGMGRTANGSDLGQYAGGGSFNQQFLLSSLSSVAQTFVTNPTNVSYLFGGGSLMLTWPASHTGWRLEMQTNASATGLGTNWTTVAHSTNINQITIPLAAPSESVFFRLAYP